MNEQEEAQPVPGSPDGAADPAEYPEGTADPVPGAGDEPTAGDVGAPDGSGASSLHLSEVEARILGCLLEKKKTTPEYYPLSLNALRNACNQKSSRDPVVQYDEATVEEGVFSLRDKQYACRTSSSDSRVAKYKHTLHVHYDLSEAEQAVICLLLLRGAQTLGELRSRSGRLFEFKELGEVQEVLDTLAHHAAGPLVAKLAREPGRKESRYAHLLSGPVADEAHEETAPPARTPPAPARSDTLARLQEEMAVIRRDVEDLKEAFARFKQQFE